MTMKTVRAHTQNEQYNVHEEYTTSIYGHFGLAYFSKEAESGEVRCTEGYAMHTYEIVYRVYCSVCGILYVPSLARPPHLLTHSLTHSGSLSLPPWPTIVENTAQHTPCPWISNSLSPTNRK